MPLHVRRTAHYPPPLIILRPSGPDAVEIIAEDREISADSVQATDFGSYPLTVRYSDGTEETVAFDISDQVADILRGGLKEITVKEDNATASFTILIYNSTISEIISEITTLSARIQSEFLSGTPLPGEDSDVFSSFCANAFVLLEDYTAQQGLAIDKYAQIGLLGLQSGSPVYIPTFKDTAFIGKEDDRAEINLSSASTNSLIEISADGITVENAIVTAASVGDISDRANAAGLFGNDTIIRNCKLINNLGNGTGTNDERTGISIQKGSSFACGPTPQIPEGILIENTEITGFDVSVNISGYATLRNVTIDSPIVITIDDSMLSNLDKIGISSIESSCTGTDAYIIIQADAEDQAVSGLKEMLEKEGLVVEIKRSELEIGGSTISPWEDGGTFEGEATL